MRTMKQVLEGTTLYESFFDPRTGNTIRRVEEMTIERVGGFVWESNPLPCNVQRALLEKYPNRYETVPAPSPSPETVDISITNRCNFGCSYCYTDSKPRLKHGRADLVATILQGFEIVPYQVALGGGEPTLHPEFPAILREAKELGTVPNYTTNGQHLPKEVVQATNDFCGGVAMTYHTHKGFGWFRDHYKVLKSALSCQVNVHLIMDRYVERGLQDLIQLQDDMNQVVNLVLLAYVPEGRATIDRLIRRTAYSRTLPRAIKRALGQGMQVAFGESLLPYFLSRPEIGVNTDFATQAEGRFSCYVDSKGFMFPSSFAQEVYRSKKAVFEEPSQKLWDELHPFYNIGGEACCFCDLVNRCSTPNIHSYLICARAPHNQLPLETPLEPEPVHKRAIDRLLED